MSRRGACNSLGFSGGDRGGRDASVLAEAELTLPNGPFHVSIYMSVYLSIQSLPPNTKHPQAPTNEYGSRYRLSYTWGICYWGVGGEYSIGGRDYLSNYLSVSMTETHPGVSQEAQVPEGVGATP